MGSNERIQAATKLLQFFNIDILSLIGFVNTLYLISNSMQISFQPMFQVMAWWNRWHDVIWTKYDLINRMSFSLNHFSTSNPLNIYIV